MSPIDKISEIRRLLLLGKIKLGIKKESKGTTYPQAEVAPATEPKLQDDVAEGESYHIDLQWFKESLKEIKWTDDTCKTFLASQYKVSRQGSLEDVIKQLTRAQAEEFIEEIRNRVDQIQMQLFD